MKKTEVICDVCGFIETKNDKVMEDTQIQFIFTTDQTEGRSRDPYLSIGKIDICVRCLKKVLEGNYLFASGAQGHNTYYFKEKSNG